MPERRFADTWRCTWPDSSHDFSASDGELRIGRIFHIEGGPGDGRWKWAMTASRGNWLGCVSGVADTRDEACRLVEDH